MKLTVFFAGDGDCLLLTSAEGRRVLIDGGRAGTFARETAPVLQQLAGDGEALDLVVVSHIDADHITGITVLLEQVAKWAVHDFQVQEGGNPTLRPPEGLRPPEIRGLWHNAWRDQLGGLAGPVEALLGQLGTSLALTPFDLETASAPARQAIESISGLAESIPDGIELLRLVDDDTPIVRNQPFDDLVLRRDPPHTEKLGGLTLTVLGPAAEDLEALRNEWKEWIVEHSRPPAPVTPAPTGSASAGRAAAGSHLGFGAADFATALEANAAAAGATLQSVITAAEIIATTDPSKVTVPNRASITLLAEEAGRTCLLTGDAAEDELLEGLAAAGRLDDGPFRCDVVKVQHHGAEHNLSERFASRVLGEHYVFCANGAHDNPDPSVVKTIVETRAAVDSQPFHLWFNCSAKRAGSDRQRRAVRAAIAEARRGADRHPGRLTVHVLPDDQAFFEIEI